MCMNMCEWVKKWVFNQNSLYEGKKCWEKEISKVFTMWLNVCGFSMNDLLKRNLTEKKNSTN